jgi:hypothetical protein
LWFSLFLSVTLFSILFILFLSTAIMSLDSTAGSVDGGGPSNS